MTSARDDQHEQQSEGTSRRDFVKTSAMAGAALVSGTTMGAVTSGAESKIARVSKRLPITMAGYKFDRVDALIDGRVEVEGCDVRFEVSSIGKMNTDALGGPMTREVTEIGLSPYMLAFANHGLRNHTLIPVFPLRLFRHKSIFIRPDRGIRKPEDLRGKKIATPGFSSTSLTWIRGIMQHQYGVSPKDVQWVIASKDSSSKVSGGPSQQERLLPDGLSLSEGPAGKDESELLVDGDVDALFHAAEPRAFRDGNPNCVRLFPDSRETERAYFAKTGIFPIMHAVAIRKDVAEENPWLPKAVFDAYSQAKQFMYEDMKNRGWYMTSLPWIGQERENTVALLGENYWPYGIEPNRTALEALFQYSHEQGLAKRTLTIEELFHPSTLGLIDSSA